MSVGRALPPAAGGVLGPGRDPALLEECRALRRAVAAHPTLASLRAAPEWPDLEARLRRLLGAVRRHPAASPPPPPADPVRVRAVPRDADAGVVEELSLAIAGGDSQRISIPDTWDHRSVRSSRST